jgi:hypothetical protein
MGKQMAELRGMKFMQRKEEARRVIDKQNEQRAAAAAAAAASTAANSAAPSAATAARVPTATVLTPEQLQLAGTCGAAFGASSASGRRNYFANVAAPAAAAAPEVASAPAASSSAARFRDFELGPATPFQPQSGAASRPRRAIGNAAEDEHLEADTQQIEAQETRDPAGLSGARYTVASSVRAPPVPASLARSAGARRDRD